MNNLHDLPQEILEIILHYIPKSTTQLLQWTSISRKFRSSNIKQEYWFEAFRNMFPALSSCMRYEYKEHISYWKNTSMKFYEEKVKLSSLSFRSLHCESSLACAKGTSHLQGESYNSEAVRMAAALNSAEQREYDKSQGIYVKDIDSITKAGFAGRVKYRFRPDTGNESLITFWELPSWRKIRSFKVGFLCQLENIQTIWMHTENNVMKKTFFSLSIGNIPAANKVIRPQQLLIYRLHGDEVQCIARLNLSDPHISADVFFFSQASWRTFSDGDVYTAPEGDIKGWLNIVSREHIEFNPQSAVFAIVFAVKENLKLDVLPFQLDIQNGSDFDPLNIRYTYQEAMQHLYLPSLSVGWVINFHHTPSCNAALHFRDPPHLSHLVAWKKWNGTMVLYDWRFGIKVGVLPRSNQLLQQRPFPLTPEIFAEETEEYQTPKDRIDAVKSTCRFRNDYNIITFLPKDLSKECNSKDALMKRGLFVVGLDYRLNGVEVRIWDVSYLLRVDWDPLGNQGQVTETNQLDLMFGPPLYPWWTNGTPKLKATTLAYRTPLLPYYPKGGFQHMLKEYYYYSGIGRCPTDVCAYKVFGASVVLLTKSEELIIVDLESGDTLKLYDLKISHPKFKATGIDVISDKEIIIIGSEGILRGLLE